MKIKIKIKKVEGPDDVIHLLQSKISRKFGFLSTTFGRKKKKKETLKVFSSRSKLELKLKMLNHLRLLFFLEQEKNIGERS